MKTKPTELHQFPEEMESEEENDDNNNNNKITDNNNNNGIKLPMWETILKNHRNSLKSLFHRNKPDFAAADDAVNSPKPIPQLSPIANSVVSRCSKSRYSSFSTLIRIYIHSIQQFFIHRSFCILFVGFLECLRMNCNTRSIRSFLLE